MRGLYCLHAKLHDEGELQQLIDILDTIGFKNHSRVPIQGGYLFVDTKKWYYQINEIGHQQNHDAHKVLQIALMNKKKLFFRHILKR